MGRTCILLAVVVWAIAPAGIAAAQGPDPDYVVLLSNETAVPGDPVDVTISVSNFGGDIEGFALGVCTEVQYLEFSAVAFGEVLQQMNDGMGPDIFHLNVDPLGGGISCGTVFSVLGEEFIFPGEDQEAIIMTYNTFLTDPLVTELCFCDTLGDPPTPTLVVVNGQSIVPMQVCGSVEFVAAASFLRPNCAGPASR